MKLYNGQSEDPNCSWTYRCCQFKEVNGVPKCEKMCEAVIVCESTTTITVNDDVEVFGELKSGEMSEDLLFSSRLPVCRRGYKANNGRCRRVLRHVSYVNKK